VTTHSDHGEIVKQIIDQYGPVLENSPDGVYLWLDESNKICNQRLAEMFGYTVDEWCAKEPFLESFVASEDQETYAWNYQTRVAQLMFPVTFRFRGVRKDGSTFAAETDMIPVAWQGHPVAYHFVRRVGD
jgi:PAS domain S-box-containing protein